MTKPIWIIVVTGVVSACQTAAVEQTGDPCDSVPPVTEKMIGDMDKERAVSFAEKNRSLMNLEIVWLEGESPASCTHMYVAEINSVENADNGEVEVGYFRGASQVWGFSPDKNYGKGRIRNGKLSVTWSYGTAEVERTEDGDLEALWKGEPNSLVPGRKKGRVKVLEPLRYK